MASKLIICIDGLGRDLISKENTPFLYEFGKENNFSRLKTLFAFLGIEYCFFTGKSPVKSRVWWEFQYCRNSIFNNIFLEFLSFNKKLRNYFGAFLQLLKKRTYIVGLHNIPFDKLRFFDSSVNEGLWKLDFFQKRSFAFYKWPFFVVKGKGRGYKDIIFRYEPDRERLERLLSIEHLEVYYCQLMEIDKVIHKFGKESDETNAVLKKIDRLLDGCVQSFLSKNKDGKVILWSDHGFADIKNCIDVWGKLPARKDFLFFIGGTTINLWFKNKTAKKEVLNVLGKIKGLHRLDHKLADKYQIPLSNKIGEEIFFVEKGSYIFPNFYQANENEKFVSMHGYPLNDELDGFLITNFSKSKKNLKIEEVFEILNG